MIRGGTDWACDVVKAECMPALCASMPACDATIWCSGDFVARKNASRTMVVRTANLRCKLTSMKAQKFSIYKNSYPQEIII